MPILSQAQQKAMFAAKAGNSTLGIPAKVGADFVAAGPAGGSYAALPKKKKPGPAITKAYSRGLVSDASMDKAGYEKPGSL